MRNVQKFIRENTFPCPYRGTKYEEVTNMNSLKRGQAGEIIVAEALGAVHNMNTNLPDVVLSNGMCVEVKSSFGSKNQNNSGNVNHVQLGKHYHRLVVLSVSVNNGIVNERMVWFTKEDVASMVKDGTLKHQSGGKGAGNDDYIGSTLRVINHHTAKEVDKKEFESWRCH